MSKTEIIASSKTYRKATGMVAEAMGVDPDHTNQPKDDFARIVAQIKANPEMDESEILALAEKYYKIGVRGGLRAATDLMVEGHFFMKGSHCWAEGTTKIKRRVRLPNGEMIDIKMRFTAKELGFGIEE